MKATRKKISAEDQAEVIFRSNRLCCVDQKRGDHIHHIDGDNSNSKIENLAFLCFDCHNEASTTGSLRKKLTPKTILKFRDHHYRAIQNQRENLIKKFNHPINKLTSEDLLNAAKDAIIILEIEKLQIEYFNVDKDKRSEVLNKFDAYENHLSTRVAYVILTFLTKVTYGTRDNMQSETAQQIYSLTVSCLRIPKSISTNAERDQLGIDALSIFFNMFYDSVIHLNNLEIAQWALLLAKHVYWFAKTEKLNLLIEKVYENYLELEKHLIRPERDDLINARNLLQIYRDDLSIHSLSFVPLPKDLAAIVYSSK